MHVEERHRAVRDVVGAEPVEGGDRPRGGRQVALEQRHLLRAARRAARVQQQRDVVRLGRLERRARPRSLPRRRDSPIAPSVARRRRRRGRSSPTASRAAGSSPAGSEQQLGLRGRRGRTRTRRACRRGSAAPRSRRAARPRAGAAGTRARPGGRARRGCPARRRASPAGRRATRPWPSGPRRQSVSPVSAVTRATRPGSAARSRRSPSRSPPVSAASWALMRISFRGCVAVWSRAGPRLPRGPRAILQRR